MNLDKHVAPPKRPTKAYGPEDRKHLKMALSMTFEDRANADVFLANFEALANLSRSSASETREASIVVRQAIQSGTLGHLELRTLFGAAWEITAVLRLKMKVDIKGLQEAAKTGKITNEIIFAAISEWGD